MPPARPRSLHGAPPRPPCGEPAAWGEGGCGGLRGRERDATRGGAAQRGGALRGGGAAESCEGRRRACGRRVKERAASSLLRLRPALPGSALTRRVSPCPGEPGVIFQICSRRCLGGALGLSFEGWPRPHLPPGRLPARRAPLGASAWDKCGCCPSPRRFGKTGQKIPTIYSLQVGAGGPQASPTPATRASILAPALCLKQVQGKLPASLSRSLR